MAPAPHCPTFASAAIPPILEKAPPVRKLAGA